MTRNGDNLEVDAILELFEGTHSAVEYRYPLSLAYLATKLTAR